MQPNDKILILGARGLVGSAIHRCLVKNGFKNILTPASTELNLTREDPVANYFSKHQPDYVFLAAAKVGGIHANSTYPADFIVDNLRIELNVIESSHRSKVQKLLFLGSSCIYPKLAQQPMKETALLSGYLEPTNKAYAIAKIAGLIMCESFNKQHATRFISGMPTNLYGPNDNYHPENSHVIPGLIHRFHEAKLKALPEVSMWGTGKPLREFLYSDDLAEACLFLMQKYEGSEIVNIGSGHEVAIADLAHLVAQTVGFQGKVTLDSSKPDGSPRKLVDIAKIQALGWKPTTALKDGLKLAYQDYLKSHGG